jgi:hypothetical protein
MMRPMRGIRLGVMAAAAALVVAAPSSAHDVVYDGTVHASGAVTIGWHGDAARGCAAAGLCGYSGALSLHPGDSDFNLIVNGRGRLVEGGASLDLFDSPPEVRVKRTEPSGDEGGCVDSSPIEVANVRVSRAGGRRVRLGLVTEGLTSGRCAGPDIAGLAARLPRRTRSVSQLTRGGASLDLSGSFPYTAGRFSGTLRSTLRLTFGKPGPEVVTPPTRPPRRPSRRRLVRTVRVHALYRVTGFAGALGIQFGGLADPPCADFDSCGTTGSAKWEVTGNRGLVVFDGDARARRTDHGVRGALAALRRRGAFVFGDGSLERNVGTTTADLSRPGGVDCHDTTSAPSAGLAASNSGQRLVFELAGEESAPAPVDLLRTGCPGPRDQDVVGFDPAATGSVPLAAFGRRSLGVRLRGAGRFSGHGYSGSHAGDFALGLERVSVRAVYRRTRVGP